MIADGRPFQRKVLVACRRIPVGKTRTYAELAAAVGSPKAARAVGRVMATNRPLPIIIPCHRVVGSAGGLGGFSAAGDSRPSGGCWRLNPAHRPKSLAAAQARTTHHAPRATYPAPRDTTKPRAPA